ncbi:MAG: hypothetical protein A4E69_01454 [Syntrophus sp. PtaB.Bin138]|nr:MAG: hypothetical protein A4E69_01454 [Syntrophus sp. PtaB.Bin138]
MERREKIFILDEAGFSRVCLSILSGEGLEAESLAQGVNSLPVRILDGAALIITSYPYGKPILNKLVGAVTPVIVLTDYMGKEIIEVLEQLENSYCMVKPIDYGRFTMLVKELVQKKLFCPGGYSIV